MLNSSGIKVWNMIVSGLNKDEIVNECVSQYSKTDSQVICDDINELIDLFYAHGILVDNM